MRNVLVTGDQVQLDQLLKKLQVIERKIENFLNKVSALRMSNTLWDRFLATFFFGNEYLLKQRAKYMTDYEHADSLYDAIAEARKALHPRSAPRSGYKLTMREDQERLRKL